jgi:DNA-binding Xre family transcriptional regulator
MIKSKNNIDTGKLIEDFITKKRIFKSNLGRDINRNGLSILAYTRNSSIQTGILIDICHALKHNFFRDIADQLPEDFTINKLNNTVSEKDQIIAQLQEENKVLTIQIEILLLVKG